MRKADLQRFRKLLMDEKERVMQSMAQHHKVIRGLDGAEGPGTGKAHSNHLADQGTDEFQYEATIQFASTEGRYLYHIEEALARIENGSYGKCEECGGNIGLERLRAVPHARLCIDCKEKEEDGQG
ncbi:MAG TPA: TraR/DksA family transcriptional regulator [Candidatus Krumholzibacteria bacterium]|nr:TraR/DksA family transcriptional regulator [Candidatus Krumholzibacteria bacterium]HPD71057.1 TraR/DksA family transcriptional regulator [Candidatus Krumholzibacteria bacterium]HRY39243.1 TraR/DksA family transcriptional regulator [Candidatus Krumholzibacteria bacterium]